MVCPTKVAGVVTVFLRNFTEKEIKMLNLFSLFYLSKPVYLLIAKAVVFTHHSFGRLQPSEQLQTPSDLRRQRDEVMRAGGGRFPDD